MGTSLFWLLRVGWIVTLLPWLFFAFGSLITHAEDSFILWYPVAMLAIIVPAEVLRAYGHLKTAWIVGIIPLLLVALFLIPLLTGPYEGFRGVPDEGPYIEYYDSGQIKAEGTWVRHAASPSFHYHTDQERPRAHAAAPGRRPEPRSAPRPVLSRHASPSTPYFGPRFGRWPVRRRNRRA